MEVSELGILVSATQKQYREDTVMVSLRLVSVSTGEILLEILTSKTILSVGISNDYFRFIAEGTELVEFESGNAMNESKSIAVQAAMETAVVALVHQGREKGTGSTGERTVIRFIIAIMFVGSVYADNEIYIDQSGDNVNIDLEQLGSSNMIGGLQSVNGSMTKAILTGGTWTLDINQIGSSNKFLTDGILGSNFTGFFEFDGDSNDFEFSMDTTGLNGADFVNAFVDVTGSSNAFDFDFGESDVLIT